MTPVAVTPPPSAMQTFKALLGTWAAPPDMPAKIALGLAGVALLIAILGRGSSVLGIGPTPLKPRIFLFATAFSSALLSVFWIAQYLHGGPRIIDATSYFLQGRALAHLDLAWPIGEPTASIRGRFLDYREAFGDGTTGIAGGIFPPGYPLLLAFGFGLGAPMIVGPLLAAALVVMTYRFTRTLLETSGAAEELVEPAARSAALLSLVCAALRYHTADTMAHGATALGIVVALDAALRHKPILTGFALGGVFATRPVSAFGVALVCLALFLRTAEGRRQALRVVLASLPGVFLLLASQKAVTGAWFASTQRMYYALSDGPPGCFRYGFGSGIGCVHEHGDFVAARLKDGHGLASALGATLRRLHMHLTDVANFEPLALLVLLPIFTARRAGTRVGVSATLAVAVLHVLFHAPFYFDGNYPGGGARFFADLLPLEHALILVAVTSLFARRGVVRAAFAVLGVSLAGFAVHAVFGHVQLADRDGGRPMFEPDVLQRSGVNAGIVFVDTDHGFSIGHDPYADARRQVKVVRLRNDDHDRMAWEASGQPASFHYRYQWPTPTPPIPGSPTPVANPHVVPWTPPPYGDTMRLEAEGEWPALAQSGGFAAPVYTLACASANRGLSLTPMPADAEATALLSLPVPQAGRYSLVPRIVGGDVADASLDVVDEHGVSKGPSWSWKADVLKECSDLPARELDLEPPTAHLLLRTKGGPVTLDKFTLKKVGPHP